jgi:ABC-type uncharacterized transport system permease subunit
MHGSKPSEDAPQHHVKSLRGWVARYSADALALAGALSIAAGGFSFHPGIGLILFGVALVLIGTRGAAASGG